jgi:hypothetical protein
MTELRRAGGIAALVEAATFVVGFALLAGLFESTVYGNGDPDPEGRFLADLVEHEAAIQTWNIVIYLVFGIALVVLALAVHERLEDRAPAVGRVATAFGLIWAVLVLANGMLAQTNLDTVLELYEEDPAQAALVWRALYSVEGGLGGDIELVGGLWVGLVSWAALRAGVPSRGLHVLGLVIGVAGVLTALPPLGDLVAVFGLGLIVWFVWTGVALLRDPTPARHHAHPRPRVGS